MKPYKGKKLLIDQLLKISAAFCIIILLIAAFKLCARAEEPRKVNFSDYPIIAYEPYIPDQADVVVLAKTVWGEARGIKSLTEQAAVVWTICNRVDSEGYAMGHSIEYVVTFPGQFHGYDQSHPVIDDYGRDLRILAADVLIRWAMEKDGYDVMRVLPKEYKWFSGNSDHTHNIFRDEYKCGNRWAWDLPSPYKS